MGTLTPIIPTLTWRLKSRAALPSRVKIAMPLPYGFSLTMATASPKVATRATLSTGPKISSS